MYPTMTEQTLQQLATLAKVELPELDDACSHVTTVELQRGECAFRQGDRQRAVFVVRSGLLKQYYVGESGDSAIKSFTARGDVFACVESLLVEGPTTFASEAIEPSVVERIEYSRIEMLTARYIEWQRAQAAAFALLARIKVRREHDLLMLTAEQMYGNFLENQPEMATRIPQKDLAGFLGITPIGLSRIAKRYRLRQSAANRR